MRLGAFILVAATAISFVGAGCASCQPSPTPTPDAGPPPPPPPSLDASAVAVTVYGELVEAGLLAPDDSGLAAVLGEYESDVRPAWLDCLFNGGTVAQCPIPLDGAHHVALHRK